MKFEKQTYTQVPNSLFKVMTEMDECELKVVLLICRYTFGYHRDEIKLSTRRIADEIGMNTASVQKGADAAIERGLIEKEIDGNKTTVWRALVGDSETESHACQNLNRRDSEIESLSGVKESIKDTSKEIGASAPHDLGLEWKLTHNQDVSQHDLDFQKEAEYRNAAGLIATGMGINSMVAFDIALSFMQARQIVIPESKVKGQRKAVKEMIQSRVSGEHVKQAVKKLIEENMTIVDLFSVSRTACDLANPKPESKKSDNGRSSERLDR
jgi:hypothetical protein